MKKFFVLLVLMAMMLISGCSNSESDTEFVPVVDEPTLITRFAGKARIAEGPFEITKSIGVVSVEQNLGDYNRRVGAIVSLENSFVIGERVALREVDVYNEREDLGYTWIRVAEKLKG